VSRTLARGGSAVVCASAAVDCASAALTPRPACCTTCASNRVDEPIRVHEEDGGRSSVLEVRAQPGARRERCAGAWNGMLKIAVAAPPEDGRANERVLAVVAALFGLRRSEVELIAGWTSRVKRIRIAAAASAVRARIAELLAELD
jgi:hypothetical protein